MRRNNLKLNIRRMTAFLLAFVFAVCLAPAVYADEVGGDCGKGVKWSLSSGTLVISGEGKMSDYGEYSQAPWADYSDSILSVRVEDGVSVIGSFAFFKLSNLNWVSLAPSVKTVGKYAFYECTALSYLDLGSVTEIQESAFEMCTSLATLRLPSTLEKIGYQAFYRCEALMGIVVPSSVTAMDAMAFTYCSSLKTAVVNASITELPYWTFYGCYELGSVTLSPTITDLGVQAFEDCDLLTTVSHGGSPDIIEKLPYTVTDSGTATDSAPDSSGIQSDFKNETTDENGNDITVSGSYTESENGIISSEVTHTKGGGDNFASIKIEAVIEQPSAWDDLHSVLVDAMEDREYSSQKETMDVTVHLKGEPELKKEQLTYFAGKDLLLSVHTTDGATWRFNGTDIVAAELEESYKLSYTLTRLDDPTEKQREVVGGSGYLVVFDHDFNIRTELLLPLGEDLARDTAVFFAPEKKEYLRMQASIIDREGIAHFYLEKIKADIEYLIGINIPNRDVAANEPQDAIIPEELKDEYPNIEQIEPIEYVITGRKSSWGLSGNQVTLILAAVMITSIVVVGVIVYIMFKAKHRNGYDPVLDGPTEEEVKAKPKSEKKKKDPTPKSKKSSNKK